MERLTTLFLSSTNVLLGTHSGGLVAAGLAVAGASCGAVVGLAGIGMTWVLSPVLMQFGLPEECAFETAMYSMGPATAVAAFVSSAERESASTLDPS